ncbi:major facilitator superfamily domain-containing protein [Phascolomyces articulosus]|uniref:Major facilitator superfamily domain-containing protein n=1 Tax=Phascolomyces articulosus TaxID=60185 RepID=A0AAD5PB43_9FUNG|nr:major facilitator superfamily domain-containing protein [Phascolomyces articulosus]
MYSKREKVLITFIVSAFCLVSALSNRSYYPALPLISKDFNVSVSLVNMTVMVYMVFQGISPCFWGPVADMWGRRPVYLISFIIFIGTCSGLAIINSFSGLLVLRMIQSFSESSCNVIGFGTIADITTSAERASYNNIIASTLSISMALSPIFGGVISNQLSWRWIFWILFILGAVSWISILLFLPETLRSHVDQDRNAALKHNSNRSDIPVMKWVTRNKQLVCHSPSSPPTGSLEIKSNSKKYSNRYQSPNFLEQILFLRHPDIFLIIISMGWFSSVSIALFMTTTPTHFSTIYNLNTLQIGLCYVPYAIGSIVGSFISSRLLDQYFKNIASKYQMTKETIQKLRNIPVDFPIYRTRLHGIVFVIAIGQLVMISYGWVLYVRAHLSVPLAFQFLVGVCNAPLFNGGNSLLIDLIPNRCASIMATSTLVASLLRALAVATVEIGIDHIGLGWTFTIFGVSMSISTLIIPVLIKYGPKWRECRIYQQKKEEQQK